MTNPESTSEPNAVPAKPVQTREPESGLPYQQDFSLVRVLLTVLILSGIGAGGWYLLLRETTPPILVPYSGRVFYKGAAVSSGGILTEPFNKDLTGAVGALDAQGRFTLMTNGQPGAYLGRHKLAVSAMTGGSPPTPIVPAMYLDLRSTPLEIEIYDQESRNTREFTLNDPSETKN
ncbi:MAG: hypothetical protein NTX48_17855 [Planctomycetales bacterium]|nr:hypothetical protein [Planctomycetales bacterium]